MRRLSGNQSKAMLTPRRDAAGFAMVELIVGLAVMVMLVATITPVTIAALDRARVERARDILLQLEEAVIAFEDDTNDWPGNLSHLSSQISTSMQRLCGANYNNGDVNQWSGPYINKPIDSSGASVVIGTAQDVIGDYSPTTSLRYLYFSVPTVQDESILLLDQLVDNSNGASSGNIWWVTGSNGTSDLFYVISINERC